MLFGFPVSVFQAAEKPKENEQKAKQDGCETLLSRLFSHINLHAPCVIVHYCSWVYAVEVNWKTVGESFSAETSAFTKMIGFRVCVVFRLAAFSKRKKGGKKTKIHPEEPFEKKLKLASRERKAESHINVNICALSEKPILVMGLKGRKKKRKIKENRKQPIIFFLPQPKTTRSAQ